LVYTPNMLWPFKREAPYSVGKLRTLLTFKFNKHSYHYFCHRYNSTWRNERTVEIPITWEELKKHNSSDVLELGNVLSHYFPTTHDVVDKYEKASSVKNVDIVDFVSKKKYSLIVSISTLEHVGWDEDKKDPQKILKAIKVMKKHLKQGGKLLVTFPLGHNPHLDILIREKKLPFDSIYFLKRVSMLNDWQEVSFKVLREKPRYGEPFPNANVIGVGIFHTEK
jgi:hypothetical protein